MIRHAYTHTVADGTATSVVRPSDWNSAHVNDIALGGNTLGASRVTGADVQWVGANGVTLSGDTAQSRIAVLGPSTSQFLTTAMRSDRASDFAGLLAQTTSTIGALIAATMASTGMLLAVPAFLTTAAQAADSSKYAGTTFAGTNISGTMNTAGLALSVAAPGGGGGFNAAQFTNSTANSTQPIVWAGATNGSGNVTMGLTGSTVTAAVATTYAGSGFTGVNATGTLNSNGLSLSIAAPGGGGAINVSAGTTNGNLQTLRFADGGGVSFGLNGSTVTATVATNYLTTAMQSAQSSNFAGTGFSSTTTVGTAIVGTHNTAGLSLGVPQFLTTAMASNATTSLPGTGMTTTTTAGSVLVGTHNSAGLSLGVPAWLTTAQAPGAYLTTARGSTDAIGLNSALTANGLSVTANSSGLSINVPAWLTTAAQSNHSHNFATTTTNGSQIVVGTTNSAGATIGVPPFITTAAAQTVQTVGVYGVGNTTGASSSSTVDARSLSFQGAGVASVGMTNGSVVISVPAGGGGGDGYNIIGVNGGGTALSTTLQLSNANNVSFGLNAGTITASASFAQSVQTQAAGNLAGVGYTSTTQAGSTVGATQNTAGLSMAWPAFLTTAQAPGAYLTTARASTDAVGLNTALTANGVSWTVNSSGISLNVPAFLTTARGSTDAIGLNTALTANGLSVTANSSGLSINVPAWLTTAAQSNHSHNFATTTTNGSLAVVATTNSAGATLAVPAWITTYVAQTTQTQPAGNIAGVGTTFAGTNVSATIGLNSNGLNLALSAPTPGGGGAINVSAGAASANVQTIQFNDSNGVSWGLNGSTVTATVATNYMASNASTNFAGTGTTFAGANISGSMTVGTNGVNLSLSAAAPGGGGGATMVEWEPVPAISTFGLSLAQNSLYINTLLAPNNVTAKHMLMGIVMTGGFTTLAAVTNSTTSTGSSSSASAGQTMNFYLFTDGAGGLETNLYTLASAQMTFSTQVSWSQTNSNTTTGTQSVGSTMGFTYGLPTITSGTVTSVNAASTVTTWGSTTGSFTGSSTFSTNGTSTSGWPGGTNNATWAGSRMVWVPLNTSLSAGEYWLGVQRSSTTAGAAVAGTYSFLAQSFTSYDTNSRWAPLGYATSQLSFLSAPMALVNGMFTTSYNSTSNYAGGFGSAGAIAKTHVFGSSATNTSGTLSRFYNRFAAELF